MLFFVSEIIGVDRSKRGLRLMFLTRRPLKNFCCCCLFGVPLAVDDNIDDVDEVDVDDVDEKKN